MSSAEEGAKIEAKAELMRLSGLLRTIAEAVKGLPSDPDRHEENVNRLRKQLEAVRVDLLALDLEPRR
jgi:hypothetical protein